MRSCKPFAFAAATAFAASLALSTPVLAQAQEPVRAAAQREKGPLLDTLKELVSIESGSRDFEGLDRLADSSPAGSRRSAARSSSST